MENARSKTDREWTRMNANTQNGRAGTVDRPLRRAMLHLSSDSEFNMSGYAAEILTSPAERPIHLCCPPSQGFPPCLPWRFSEAPLP